MRSNIGPTAAGRVSGVFRGVGASSRDRMMNRARGALSELGLHRMGQVDLRIDDGLLDALLPVVAELVLVLRLLVGVDDRAGGVDQGPRAVRLAESDAIHRL